MNTTSNDGNLIFDISNPLCSMTISASQGKTYAFITALDIGMPHSRLKEPQKKHYWGGFSWEDQEGSIKDILHRGGKWPELNI